MPRDPEIQRRWRAANPEKVREYNRRRRETYAEKGERERKLAWREANRERYNETRRKNYATKAESERERARRYREANREKILALRRVKTKWLDDYRRTRGCVDCGTREGRLDLDHRDDEAKLFSPALGASESWARLKAEVAKCDVRCASCHTKRHMVAIS